MSDALCPNPLLNSNQMKKLFAIATIAGLGSGMCAEPSYARCGEGMKQLGMSNRCIPIDPNDFSIRQRHCKNETLHYGNNALMNGAIKNLDEYYAACMGKDF